MNRTAFTSKTPLPDFPSFCGFYEGARFTCRKEKVQTGVQGWMILTLRPSPVGKHWILDWETKADTAEYPFLPLNLEAFNNDKQGFLERFELEDE